jgi:hypothetical protein
MDIMDGLKLEVKVHLDVFYKSLALVFGKMFYFSWESFYLKDLFGVIFCLS